MSDARDHHPTSGPLPGVDVTAGQHAIQQWTRRGDPTTPIEAAWTQAHEMTLPEPEYRNVDEARYHPETRTVLLRQASGITTALDAHGPESQPTVRDGVAKQFGGDSI